MLPPKRLIVSIAVLVAFCVGFYISIGVPASGQEAAATKSKMRTLLEERRDVLKARFEECKKLLSITRIEYSGVLAANNDYLDAELDLTSDKAERLTLLEKKLVNAKEGEQAAESMKLGGRGLQTNVLMATANRLAVEIAIEREKE